MAKITNTEKYSSILVGNKLHFVFGNINMEADISEKIKFSIDAMRECFELLNIPAPNVNFNWKTAIEGEWVLSDDYRVVEILKRTENPVDNAYNKAIVRTCVGTFAVNKLSWMDTDFDEHPDRYRVSSVPRNHIDKVKTRDTITKKEVLFAKYVAKGYKPNVAYSKVYNSKNDVYVKQMANTLVTQERVQSVVNDEVSKILEEQGVNKEYIIQSYKQLIDDGLLDLKNCAPSVRSALKDLADMSGMSAQKNKSIESKGALREIDDDMLSQIEEAEVLIESIPQIGQHNDYEKIEIEEEDFISKAGRSLIE